MSAAQQYGQNIQARLAQLGKTQTWLAGEIGSDQPSISQVVGGRWPGADTQVAIEAALDVSHDDLMGGDQSTAAGS